MVLWSEAESEVERNEIVADLQDEIDARAEAPKKPVKKPYVKFDDLEAIAKDVVKFKNALRKVVDRHGGIAKLAEALNLNEKEIVNEWVA
jgi:hypothetical protein